MAPGRISGDIRPFIQENVQKNNFIRIENTHKDIIFAFSVKKLLKYGILSA